MPFIVILSTVAYVVSGIRLSAFIISCGNIWLTGGSLTVIFLKRGTMSIGASAVSPSNDMRLVIPACLWRWMMHCHWMV